jgi:conjugative transfer pilus assembly protein TraH
MKLKKVVASILLCSSLFADGMQEFANGVVMSTTSSGSMSTRDRTILYGGGVSIKAPILTLNPINVQAPTIKAGCGGIDLAFGSLSFLDADQIVKFLEATLANAEGVAFDIALKTLCPSCSETLKAMEAMANQINNMSLDSCKAATQLVNAGYNAIDGKSLQEDMESGSVNSWLKGAADNIQTGADYLAKFNEKLSFVGTDDKEFVIGKYLSKANADQVGSLGTRSLIKFITDKNNVSSYFSYNIIATFIGDIIIQKIPTDEEKSHWELKPKDSLDDPISTNQQKIAQSNFNTNTRKVINRLLGADDDQGEIYYTGSNADYTIKNVDGYLSKGTLIGQIKDNLNSIIGKIQNRTILSDDDINFLGQFQTPVYPIFNTLGSNDITRDILEYIKDDLSLMLANQIFYEYITQFTRFMQDAIAGVKTHDEALKMANCPLFISNKGKSLGLEHLEKMAKNSRAVAGIAYQNYIKSFQGVTTKLHDKVDLLKQLQDIRNFTINRSSPEIFNNLLFNKAISGN